MGVIKKVGRDCLSCGNPLCQRYEYGGEQALGGSPEMDPVGPVFCRAGCDQPLGG